MRPANPQQAEKQMTRLLERKLNRIKATTKHEHIQRAKVIINSLYRQYHIGPYQVRLLHLQWYLTTQINHLKPATQYRHWLTIERIIKALGKYDHWQTHLQGTWRQPDEIA